MSVNKNSERINRVKRPLILVFAIVVLLGGLTPLRFFVLGSPSDRANDQNENPRVSDNQIVKHETSPNNSASSSYQFDSSKAAKIKNFEIATESLKKTLLEVYFGEAEKNCNEWNASAQEDMKIPYVMAVLKMVRDDFAGVQFCTSGGTSVFANTDEGWKNVTNLADTPLCETVDQYRISKEITSLCGVPYGNEREVIYP